MVMNIQVLIPQRTICRTVADEVVLPGLVGQIGVLNGHATLVTSLATGLLRIRVDQKWTPILVCGGLAEIDRDVVTVLAIDGEDLSSVDMATAQNNLQKANLDLESADSETAQLEASADIKKASATIEALQSLT
jgi:F-type H+-transporting ATPase subunit epsilon